VSLDIDGFAVFAAIGANRDLFRDLASEIDKAARALVVKQLKRKQLDLPGLRALRKALGAETLALILDALGESDISAVLAKCDKHNAETKTANDGWRRSHLNALAAGETEPTHAAKPKGGKKSKIDAPAPRKNEDVKMGLNYASAGRVRKSTR
jgi:hypothetical protein